MTQTVNRAAGRGSLRGAAAGGMSPDVMLAVALVLLTGARIGYAGVPLVLLAISVTIPVWWPIVVQYRGFLVFACVALGAVVNGFVLAQLHTDGHAVDRRAQVLQSALLLGAVAGVAAVLWLRHLARPWVVALVFGLGAFLAIRANAGVLENPWRFGFSVPVICTVLALAASTRRRGVEMAACGGLILVSAWSGSRSRTAVLVVVLILVAVQLWRPTRRRAMAGVRILLLMVAGAAAVYEFGQAIILEGYIGQGAQERSAVQIAQSGSLILGGRPEMAATAAMAQDSPLGYGTGVAPTMHDLAVAKSGLLGIGYEPDNGYVESYMFGDGIELHSVVADLWARHSLLGVVLGLCVLVLVAAGLIGRIAERRAQAVTLFVGISALWDLAFSPLLTSVPLLVLAVGLLMKKSTFRTTPPIE